MIQRIDNTNWRAHDMLSSQNSESNALTVMEKADALFDVYYPPASWNYGGHSPVVSKGKNAGVPLYKWVVRADNNEPLGLHSGTFPESGSYRHVGEMAEQMFPNSTTSCTLFGNGERMALTQNIGDKIDLGQGDVIQPSIMWISSFNGQWSTSVYDLVGRLFCANQLVGQTPLLSVKHTLNHDITFQQRTHVLNHAIANAENISRMARVMKDQAYTDGQFASLIKFVVPHPKFIKDKDGYETDKIHARAEKTMLARREAMTVKWREECEEFGNIAQVNDMWRWHGNKWLAYNAVQGAEQHSINAKFLSTSAAREQSLTKAVNGKTPYAERALKELSYHGAAA